MRTWLKRLFCDHRCYVEEIARQLDDTVTCPCHLCGKLLRAPYGLALKAKLENRPKR